MESNRRAKLQEVQIRNREWMTEARRQLPNGDSKQWILCNGMSSTLSQRGLWGGFRSSPPPFYGEFSVLTSLFYHSGCMRCLFNGHTSAVHLAVSKSVAACLVVSTSATAYLAVSTSVAAYLVANTVVALARAVDVVKEACHQQQKDHTTYSFAITFINCNY